ncbi:uncharacterized protein EKO05_0000841 [Ascochyta rabiei]|uniref:DNA binding n=1 Tax=Didymella rabiei TaxID=5454 RepID=A0A163CHG4_DIDRA|nr:uncharacterized protein EKO05_0000841 [Ascochyta rabiei]KZM22465.1 DNA binding [Ascochyta rabiei]UPX10170.1 hypothetical protein EKO05_0000841 [Ascochyta rabiei]
MRPSLHVPWLKNASLLLWHPRAPPQSLVPRRIATTSAHNAAPVDLPRLIVPHGSKDHNSLATFIEYANRAKLSPLRTYYVGTHYEYTAALSLMRLGFSLLRTGAKNDAGIDLIGHWVLAPLNEPLPVIIQCKARTCSLGPCHVRELEGSFRAMPAEWRRKPVLGLLATTLKATKGTMEAIRRSSWPMGFVMISRQGLIQQFVWNRAASDHGLQGVGVTVRHTPRALLVEAEVLKEVEEKTSQQKKRTFKFANAGTQTDIQLTWMGSPIFPERDTLDRETLDLIALAAPKQATEQPKRRPGRPKKGEEVQAAVVRLRRGPKRTRDNAPSPRGGQVAKPRHPLVAPKGGRPKGAKNKVKSPSDVG